MTMLARRGLALPSLEAQDPLLGFGEPALLLQRQHVKSRQASGERHATIGAQGDVADLELAPVGLNRTTARGAIRGLRGPRLATAVARK